MTRSRATLRRLVMVVGMIVLAGTLSGCHELWCNFVEGLTGEPLDCSHDAFPDLGDIDFPPLPPPPSLPITTTTQVVSSTTAVPPTTTTTLPDGTTTTTGPDGTTTTGPDGTTTTTSPGEPTTTVPGEPTTTTRPSAARPSRADPEEPPVPERTTTGTIRERVEQLRQQADDLRRR